MANFQLSKDEVERADYEAERHLASEKFHSELTSLWKKNDMKYLALADKRARELALEKFHSELTSLWKKKDMENEHTRTFLTYEDLKAVGIY